MPEWLDNAIQKSGRTLPAPPTPESEDTEIPDQTETETNQTSTWLQQAIKEKSPDAEDDKFKFSLGKTLLNVPASAVTEVVGMAKGLISLPKLLSSNQIDLGIPDEVQKELLKIAGSQERYFDDLIANPDRFINMFWGGVGAKEKIKRVNEILAEYPHLKEFQQPDGLIENVVKFYAEHYDIFSEEGREKFLKYLQENPSAVISDAISIATIPVAGVGAAGTAAKTGKIAGKAASIASKTDDVLKGLAANKYLSRPARVAEAIVDPVGAGGRAGGELLAKLKTTEKVTQDSLNTRVKTVIGAEDDVKGKVLDEMFFSPSDAKYIQDYVENSGLDALLDKAFADGFSPDALKATIAKHPELKDNLLPEHYAQLEEIAEQFSEFKEAKKLQDTVNVGRKVLPYIGGGAGGAITNDWTGLLIGMLAGNTANKFFENNPIAKYIMISEPKGWQEFATKMKIAGSETTKTAARTERTGEQ